MLSKHRWHCPKAARGNFCKKMCSQNSYMRVFTAKFQQIKDDPQVSGCTRKCYIIVHILFMFGVPAPFLYTMISTVVGTLTLYTLFCFCLQWYHFILFCQFAIIFCVCHFIHCKSSIQFLNLCFIKTVTGENRRIVGYTVIMFLTKQSVTIFWGWDIMSAVPISNGFLLILYISILA